MVTFFAQPLYRIAVLCIMSSIILGCSVSNRGPSEMDDLVAISEFNQKYLQAINEGDIDLLSSLTTEGHMMISSGGEPLSGKAANIDAMRGAFQRFNIDETWTPLETEIDGDLAYQRGVFTVKASPKGGDGSTADSGTGIETSGNFLRIYKRQDNGEWRMVRDMFTSG